MLCYVRKSIKMMPTSIKKQLSNPCSNVDRFKNQLGCVLGGFGGGFWKHFGPDLVDFEGSERRQISSSKLEAEKVVSGT